MRRAFFSVVCFSPRIAPRRLSAGTQCARGAIRGEKQVLGLCVTCYAVIRVVCLCVAHIRYFVLRSTHITHDEYIYYGTESKKIFNGFGFMLAKRANL